MDYFPGRKFTPIQCCCCDCILCPFAWISCVPDPELMNFRGFYALSSAVRCILYQYNICASVCR